MKWFVLLAVFFIPSFLLYAAETTDNTALLKERIITECQSSMPAHVENCVVTAGNGVLAKNELDLYQDSFVEPLCLSKSGKKMLAYLSCLDTQLSIKKNSPLPQYSTLILRTDQFRTSWVSICKSKHGLNISDCVKSKTASFFQAWNAYLNLEKSPEKISRFESCISEQRDSDWDVFVNCYHR